MEATIPKKRWRPRLRFSLRTLMIAMTVVCVFLGYRVHRAHEQRDAVAALEEAGARIIYDWDDSETFPFSNQLTEPKPPGPAWLRSRIGDEYFQEVVEIRWYADSAPEPGVFAHLARLPFLRELEFDGPHHAQLAADKLPRMKVLEELRIYSLLVNDEVMERIGQLTSLKSLDLSTQRALTPVGVAHLVGLQNLKTLALRETSITDEAMPYIGQLHELQRLCLDRTYITDAGVAHLNQLHDLRAFSALGSSDVGDYQGLPIVSLGDQSLQVLGQLPKLNSVAIGIEAKDARVPRITSKGLESLLGLHLVGLCLEHTSIADENFYTLNKKFPELEWVRIWAVAERTKPFEEEQPNVRPELE